MKHPVLTAVLGACAVVVIILGIITLDFLAINH